MQNIFIAILLIISLTSYGQQGKFNPFKLIIIKPDTAIIDKSLYGDIDSVEGDYLKRYYDDIKQMEKTLSFKDYPKGMEKSFKEEQEKLEKELPLIKAQEPEIKKFRYFQTLSAYSGEVYNFYYNEYEPFSPILALPAQKTDTASLRITADTSKAGYIVFFSNVHTEERHGMLVLKLTTSLYSAKEKKIILESETEGDADSRGFMWTCGSTKLSCLLINGVRTSTDAVAPVIAKLQLRK